MRFEPKIYQAHDIEHVIDNPACGLFLDMGLGKTVITLTAFNQLKFDYLEVEKLLVIAPKLTAENTWANEAAKWDHLKHLKFSHVLGSESKRKAALRTKADVYVINRENTAWLVAYYGGAFPFPMVAIDESSSFKNPKSARFKALRQVRPKINRVVLLTGTPRPNGLMDIWSQIYLLDQGERLGKTITSYRERYFVAVRNTNYTEYFERTEPDELIGSDYYEKKIYEKIGDICISMKKEDWLDLPERIDRIINVSLPAEVKSRYDEFEKKQILALENTAEISAVNAAGLTNKLLQFSNGAVYDDEKNWHEVHKEKLEALEEIIEVANGKPVLVFYSYKHDKERILKYLSAYKPKALESGDNNTLAEWNERKIKVLVAYPTYGLNMQAGGNIIVWFGLHWNLELYQQGNARLDRQGQTESVIVHHLVIKGTMDEDVMLALENKANGQEAMMQAVKARVGKYISL